MTSRFPLLRVAEFASDFNHLLDKIEALDRRLPAVEARRRGNAAEAEVVRLFR
jgi:hypothetical protein